MAETVLLTGATGFLGSYLLESLLNSGRKVVILKRSTSDLWRIKHLAGRFVSYDADLDCLSRPFQEHCINTVIHTVCNYGRKHEKPSEIAETNLMFSLRLLEASISFNTDSFFNTDTLLQKYLNEYTLSKKQFVEWLKLYAAKNIKIVNMKLEHMYGSRDDNNKFVPWLISQLKEGVPEIKLTPGEQKRDFIHVADVASAYLAVLNSLEKLCSFSEFDVGTGTLTTLRDFVQMLKQSYDNRFGETRTNLNFGALNYREGETMEVKVDNRELINLSWVPQKTLQTGLIEMMENMK